MGRFVIAAYKPKPGMDDQLLAAVEKHWRVLASENLVSARPPYVMRAMDGTIIEVFEWLSSEAIERAHKNPAVHALWAEFGAACDYVALNGLAEAREMFAEFEPLAL